MRPRHQLRNVIISIFSVIALVALQGMALATTGLSDGDDSTLVDEAIGTVTKTAVPPEPALLEPVLQEEDSDSDSGDGASASAYGQVIDVDLGGQDLVTVSQSSSSASENNGSSADATVLAIAGQELFGAHSESTNGSHEDETGLLMESCEMSGGQICLALLYGYAATSDDADQSTGTSDTAVAEACLGGSDGERRPTEYCDGPVYVSALDSHSDSSVDKQARSAAASESSNGAYVCLGGVNEDGICDGLGVRVLHSESSASASPDGSDSDGSSYVLGVEQGGSQTTFVEDEQHIDVPPDCPEGSSVICIGINEGGSEADSDGSSNGQTIINIDILPGEDDGNVGDGDVGEVGTQASPGGPDDGPDDEVEPKGPVTLEQRDPITPQAAPAQLPFTGAGMDVFIVLAILAIIAGAAVMNATRRRST